MTKTVGLLCTMILALSGTGLAATASEITIEGKYLEVRSCDVFTAACFANSEGGLTGEEAIMAWEVARGSFQDMPLDGLKVVAVLRTSETLMDTSKQDIIGRAIVYVDEKATPDQQEALVAMATELSNGLIDEVIRVEHAPIKMSFRENHHHADNHFNGHSLPVKSATLTAGEEVEVSTRALSHHDMHCGNDEAFYPPLTNVTDAAPGFTEIDRFTGTGLNVKWNESGRRSAYLATFAH